MGKTWLLVGVLMILTGALLYLSLFGGTKAPVPSPQITEAPKEKAQTSLSISSEQKFASGSSLLKTNILISSGSNKITGAQLELTYDPAVLTKVEITAGDFMKNSIEVLKKIDPKTGRISYVLGSKLNEIAQGNGILATITYLRLNNKVTQVNFLPQTLITAQGFSESVLVGTTPGVLEIKPSLLQNYSTASSTIR